MSAHDSGQAIDGAAMNRERIGKGCPPKHTQFKPGNRANPAGRPKGLVQRIRERTQNGTLLVDFIFHVFQGKPIDGRNPTFRDRMAAAEWLAAHGFGRPVPMELPPQEDKPRLTIIFSHPRDYDPIALGKGQPTRIVDATVRELAPAPAERGTHEVLSGDDL